MTSKEIERITTIKRTHEKRWLAIDGVVAIGIGTTSSGKTGLIVSVKGDALKIRGQIPNRIDDTEVEIQVTGSIKAL